MRKFLLACLLAQGETFITNPLLVRTSPFEKGGLRGIKKPEKLFIYDVGKDEM